MYDPHPLVLIFFIALLIGGEIMYLPTAWPQIGLTHKVFGSIAIFLPYLFLYLSVMCDPGTITPGNLDHHMSLFPYDFSIFHPGQKCSTCDIYKPPRSKHCSICKRCIGRLDHHCIFINNCVGIGNHHWFLLLLFSTGVLTLYGGLLGLSLTSAKIRSIQPHWTLWQPHARMADGTTPMTLDKWLIMITYALQSSIGMGSVTLLSILTSPLVWGLLCYHVYLVYSGTTTNESMKWSDWQAEMDDGCAFKRKLAIPPLRPRYVGEAEWTRWPVEAEQILVRTRDGQFPTTSGQHPLAGEGEWMRVWRLRDVENLYDLGFWENMVDIFRPGHLFHDSKKRLA
jgi:palmitoyltransferase ZDHHC4